MRVAVDATLVSARLKGAGRVVKNLLQALPAADPDSTFVAMARTEGVEVLGELPGVQVSVPDYGGGLAWELRGMGREAERLGADVLLTLREIVGFSGPPTLMHVAEPPAYRLRGLRGRAPRYVAKDVFLQAMLRGSVKRAGLVTAAGRTTAEWLRERYGIDPPVIPPGIDPFFLERLTEAPDEPPFLLHPATGDRRDNTGLVLEGFARSGLAREGVHLRLMGAPASDQPALLRQAETLSLPGALDFVGWVSDERLRELYRGAIALVHPTSYEGFAGLQALEAMAQGTPVIALDSPGVTEALESVSELLPAADPGLMSKAMQRVVSDDAYRERLGGRGMEFARGFTWERAASAFVSVLRGMRVSSD